MEGVGRTTQETPGGGGEVPFPGGGEGGGGALVEDGSVAQTLWQPSTPQVVPS